MAVPVGADFFRCGVFCTAVNLHKTHAAFDEPPRQKALPAKGTDVFVIELVELFGDIGFTAQVGDFGRAELQACREFIRGDARFELGVARALSSMPLCSSFSAGTFGGGGGGGAASRFSRIHLPRRTTEVRLA